MAHEILNGADIHGGLNVVSGPVTYNGPLTGGTDVINIGSGQFYKDASGNVGIGTTSPGARFAVSAPSANFRLISTTTTGSQIRYTSAATGSFGFVIGLIANASGEALIYHDDAKAIRIYTAATQRAMWDAAGNYGHGVTPSAWGTGAKAFEVGFTGSALYASAQNNTSLLSNAYYDGTNFRYAGTGAAHRYQQQSGGHFWYSASSGAAGAIATFTQVGQLDNSGNLSIAGLTATGNVVLGDASTDTVRVNGYMGVGAAAVSSAGLYVANTALQTTNAFGAVSEVTANSANTAQLATFYAQPKTAAAAFTVDAVYGYRLVDAVLGAGSAIITLSGISIANLTKGTNNYGITSELSAGANKRNLNITGTADNYLAGLLGVGATPSAWGGASNVAIDVSTGAAFAHEGSTGAAVVASNAYKSDATTWRYKITNTAGHLAVNRATLTYATASSGTAGNAITFTNRFQVTTSRTEALNGAYFGNAANVDTTVLDHYEEGSFTPTVAGGSTAGVGTYTTQSGKYTRIGNRVDYTINIAWTAHTGTGTTGALINGLPFTSSADVSSGATTIAGAINVGGAGKIPIGSVGKSVTQVWIRAYDQATSTSIGVNVTFPTTGNITISGTYFI